MRFLIWLSSIFFTHSVCLAAYPVQSLAQYVELFRGFGSVEICAESDLSYNYAIKEKNRIALALRNQIGGPTACYRMGQDKLILNESSTFEYMACARVRLADHCSFK